jgi:hypothetical protein
VVPRKRVATIYKLTAPELRAAWALVAEVRGSCSPAWCPTYGDDAGSFEGPSSRDITETVSTLAHMARFVIADITDAKSIPQELKAIVPNLPSVPVQPLLLASQQEYGMFEHIRRYSWVLEPFLYEDQDGLLAALTEKVIDPAEKKAKEQTGR